MPKKKDKSQAPSMTPEELEQVEALKAMGLNTDVTLIKRRKLSKQDQAALESNAFTADDEFSTLHEDDRRQIINPPFHLRLLVHLCAHNNALMQNIAAMEVNIDGTGHEIVPKDLGTPEDEADKQKPPEGEEPVPTGPTPEEIAAEAEQRRKQQVAEDFFNEPWPNTSFMTMRRELRRGLEVTGVAYLEVIRNPKGEIMLVNNVDPTTIRLVRLDMAVVKDITLMRRGREMNVKLLTRERRYMQRTGTVRPENVAGTPKSERGKGMVFFKEYKASRELNKLNGTWEAQDKPVPMGDRASELIMFTVNKMPGTPYGVPRWINQTPSVLGSRKAEELNLDFFNSGGLPPAMIIIQGGVLTEVVRQQIQTYLSGKGASKNRAMVIEVHSAGGDMDKPGNVKVSVERFGGERLKDSMFENYNTNNEKRVRSSFRMPPLFVGKSEDMNFATAKTSYMIAEAQVFKPEREEFDEVMNKTIMREIAPDFEFHSLPITLRDVDSQIKGVELAIKAGAVTNKDVVETLNEVVDLSFEVPEDVQMIKPPAPPMPPGGIPEGVPNGEGGESMQRIMKIGMEEVIHLAQEWAAMTVGEKEPSPDARKTMVRIVKNLPEQYKGMFHHLAAISMMAGYGHDPAGADQLSEIAALAIHQDHDHGDG